MKRIPRAWVEIGIACVGVLVAALLLDVSSVSTRIANAGPFAQAYDLAITKTDGPDPVIAGNNLTYTIVVTNTGAATDYITVSDTLPPGTTFQSLTTSDFTCMTPLVGQTGAISCQRPSMASPTDSRMLTVVVNVDNATPKNTVIMNTASVKPSTCTPPCDSDPSNDMSTASTLVDTQADLSLTKTATPDPVPAENLVSYTLTVTNNGPSAAQDVMITDTIPATTTFDSVQPNGSTCVTPPPNGVGMVKCTFAGATLPTQSHSIVITVRTCAGGTCGGQLTNAGQTSSSTFDPDTNNNTATVTSTVLPVPAPLLSGIGLLIEILLLLVSGWWALARVRVARR